jgi:REP element-mobilizing transposase RayT
LNGPATRCSGKTKVRLCEEILKEVAEKHKIEIIKLSVMPAHLSTASHRHNPANNEPIKAFLK